VTPLERIMARTGERKALVAYLCVGDPGVEESIELARACLRAGADVVELGVPFSDPTADGPAIARASQRALKAGGGLEPTLHAAKMLRKLEPDAGIVVFGYYNPVFVYGETRAVTEAALAGVDALLLVDLPIEESGPLRAECVAAGVGLVPLLTPTSSAERVEAVRGAAVSGGVPFVYYVSMTGVTGSAGVDARGAGDRAAVLRGELGRPVVVGFGIDSADKARAAASQTDGVVAGTAIVKLIEEGRTPRERVQAVEGLVRELRAGVDASKT
jgi:tryptophan synthase alpha chain